MINFRVCLIYFIIQQILNYHQFFTWAAREPPSVNIPQGSLLGMYMTKYRTQRIIAYLGIPYAQPPLESRRFAPPDIAKLPTWEGVRNATQQPPDCMQPAIGGEKARHPPKRHDEMFAKLLRSQVEDPAERFYDEDCLYLNIYIPDGTAPTDGLATLVWFHGGDFVRGSPHDINPFQLVFKQRVIVVTVAYRLNIFGFFTTMDSASPGNFGLMDQAVALDWIKNNIDTFGGSKENICIFGQGSGAVSVGLHLISGEWSQNSFQKVIAMSGNILAPYTVKSPRKESITIDRVASAFGCFRKPTSALISCLRNVPLQALLDQGEPISDWGPIVDFGLSNTTKPFISDYPIKLFEKGLFQKVAILTGFTDMEDALLLNKEDSEDAGITKQEYDQMISDIVLGDIVNDDDNGSCYTNQQHIHDAVSFFYNPMPPTTNETLLRKLFLDFYTEKVYGSTTYLLAKYMSPHTSVYLYRFDLKPLSKAANEGVPSWVGVAHNFDLIYVFGLPYLALPADLGKWDSSDKSVADIIMRMWANFALYSNPTNSGIYVTWEPFKTENPGFLVIDRNFNMSSPANFNYKAFEFWNEFYPKVLEIGTQCCNDNSTMDSYSIAVLHFSCVNTQVFLLCIAIGLGTALQ